MLYKLIFLGAAGALGTLARYGLSGAFARIVGPGFPWGTFAVNVIGCFFFGLVWSGVEGRHWASTEFRHIALVGFFGAFTTFSTFAFETWELSGTSGPGAALVNLMAHNLIGVMCLVAGIMLGRMVF